MIFVAISGTFYAALSASVPGSDPSDPALHQLAQPLNPPAAGAPVAVAAASKTASVNAFRLAIIVCGALLVGGAVTNGVGLREGRAKQAVAAAVTSVPERPGSADA